MNPVFKFLIGLAFAPAALVLFVSLLGSTEVEPVEWSPPPAPSLEAGDYASNNKLEAMQWHGQSNLPQPESVAIGPDGFYYTGLNTGEIVRLNPAQLALANEPSVAPFDLVINTGGRPLGMIFHPDGSLIVADGVKGLLQVSWAIEGDRPVNASMKVLSTEAEGQAFQFVDDVAVSSDGGKAWFSDASSKFAYPNFTPDILEHGGNGRLLEYDFATGETLVLLKGLQFANGVASANDDAFVLVNETGAYQITRYWLKGPKAGLAEPFVTNLPGFPDNIRADENGNFWVALPAGRDPLIDALADKPAIRHFVAKLLNFVEFPVKPFAMAVAFDSDGQLVANLQDESPNGYYHITQVTPVGRKLLLGSVLLTGFASIDVPAN